MTHAHVKKLVYIHTNHCLIRRIRERGLCLIEVSLGMMGKEEDGERFLRMQNQAIDENDEVHEDILLMSLKMWMMNMIEHRLLNSQVSLNTLEVRN